MLKNVYSEDLKEIKLEVKNLDTKLDSLSLEVTKMSTTALTDKNWVKILLFVVASMTGMNSGKNLIDYIKAPDEQPAVQLPVKVVPIPAPKI